MLEKEPPITKGWLIKEMERVLKTAPNKRSVITAGLDLRGARKYVRELKRKIKDNNS